MYACRTYRFEVFDTFELSSLKEMESIASSFLRAFPHHQFSISTTAVCGIIAAGQVPAAENSSIVALWYVDAFGRRIARENVCRLSIP